MRSNYITYCQFTLNVLSPANTITLFYAFSFIAILVNIEFNIPHKIIFNPQRNHTRII